MTEVGRASKPRFQHMYTLRYDTRSAMQRQAKIKKFDGTVLSGPW